MSGLLLSGSLACAAATPPIQPASPLATVLKMETVDSSYAICFRNEHGKLMHEAASSSSITHRRRSKLQRDGSAHTATLTLQAKDHESKLSPTEIAALNAASSGKTFLTPGRLLPRFRRRTTSGRPLGHAALRGHATLVDFFFLSMRRWHTGNLDACGLCAEASAASRAGGDM